LSASSPKPPEDSSEWVKVPLILSERSFDEQQEAELYEIFQRNTEQLRRHTAEWQQTVKRMRERFVKLHPVDADSTATSVDDVIVDSEKMRTLFFEYPSDDVNDDRVLPTLTSTPSTERPLPTRYQVSNVWHVTH